MTKNTKIDLSHKIEMATSSLNDAKILIENDMWISSIDRIYYACFYAVTALLKYNSIEAKTQDEIKIKFIKNFMKTGKIDQTFGKLYSDLFDWRTESGFSDLDSFDKNLMIDLIKKSEDFIILIKTILQTKKE